MCMQAASGLKRLETMNKDARLITKMTAPRFQEERGEGAGRES